MPGLGVLGSTILATTGGGGSGPGILFNDVQPGDDAKEFRAEVLVWPSSGTLDLLEDGRFTYTGASANSFTYRGWADGVTYGDTTVSLYASAAATVTIAATGAVTYSGTVAMSADVLPVLPGTVTASIAASGGVVYGGTVAMSVDVLALPPGTVTASIAALGAVAYSGTVAMSATVMPMLPVVQASIAALGGAVYAGTVSMLVREPPDFPESVMGGYLSRVNPDRFMSVVSP